MAAVRLPGIYFETVKPPTTPLLPRMDIAAFAGFLPSGPIGVPFAVEDPDRFADIFGTDLALAWDRQRNEMLLAQTPPAVRMFFRNGGTRCWVLRLASGALSNAWVIPGLLAADANGGIHAGWVQARSEGSWSDDLTVNATLLESPVTPSSVTLSGSSPQVTGLNSGDMVQLYFPSTETVAYNASGDSRWFWFQQISTTPSPPGAAPDSVVWLGPGCDTVVPFSAFAWQTDELVLTVTRCVALGIPPGSWLKMAFGNRCLLVQVEMTDAAANSPASPPSDETATLTSTLAWWVLDPATALAANQNQTVQTSVVTFELWAWPTGEPVQRIADLCLGPVEPRYWDLLPTDSVLYAPVDQPTATPYAGLAADIDNPRFDLAGSSAGRLGLPLGMTALVRSDFTQGASQPGGTALNRDGLTNFSQDLFIDRNLSSSTAATLLQDAFYYQYQSPSPATPTAIEALLATDEISLLAVPDAIQPGWQLAPAASPTLGAPAIQVSSPDEGGTYIVSWSAVAGASGYSVQESSDPLFGSSVTTTDAEGALSLTLTKSAQGPLELYYRVSAYGTAGVGPWPGTASVQLGTGDFAPCNALPLKAPTLSLTAERNRITLQWTPAPGGADSFTLQSAGDPQFDSGIAIYQGGDTSFETWQTPGPSIYFRVNAQRGGKSSPWSATVSTAAEPVSPWEVNDPSSASQNVLLAVHRAMVRMGAARGDLVAILSLPVSHYTADALAYTAEFAQFVAAEDTGTLLSYGAMYHPWIVTPDTATSTGLSLRTVVPDGAVCGLIASKALASGAWIAPANLAIANAVALEPALPAGTATAFFAGQINLIAQQPGGFILTGQDTLITQEPDLQPLNVRRLMIVLRRLALREGVRYVFQNISGSFRRAVTRQFTQWMQQLLSMGAFAGSSAADSYRVVTDASVNTPAALDQGQFVVELQVAPSVPMRFLTVRLVQTGGLLTIQET